jgi:hypothetical protein
MAGLLGIAPEELALIGGLLSGKKGENWGQHFMQLAAAQDAKKRREQQEMLMKQQMEQGALGMEQSRMQLEQARRQQGIQDQLRQAAGDAFRPPQEAAGPMPDGVSPLMLPGGRGMNQFAQDAMRIDPLGVGMQFQPKPREPKFHNVNGHLVQEPTEPGGQARPVFQAPREQWRELGRDPQTKQMIMENTLTGERKAVGSMPPQVNVDARGPRLENEEQKGKGQLNIKNFGDLQGLAASARKENALLTGLERLDLDTSKLTPLNTTVSAWVGALGGGKRFSEKAAQGEGFTGFAKELVLQRQLAQKGPQTESDAKRLEQTTAQLGNTAQANKLLVTFNKAINNRIIAQEKFYNEWWRKNKTMEGADMAWFEGEGGTSLWDTDPSLKKFQGPSSSGVGNVIRFDKNGNQL